MSIRGTDWAWEVEGLTSTEAFVLVCLADHHNGKSGLCFPSNERIAQRTRFGLTAVKAAIASLTRKGLIAIYPGKGRVRRLFVLAITERPSGVSERPPAAPAHIEPESNREEARKRAFQSSDLRREEGARRDWRNKPPEPKPPEYFRAIADKRIAETRAMIADTVTDRPSPEERAAIVERALRGMPRDLPPESRGPQPSGGCQGGWTQTEASTTYVRKR